MFYYFNAEMKYYEKPFVPPPFADGSDEEIALALQKYYNDEFTWQDLGWSVGDTRKVHMDALQFPDPYSSDGSLPAEDITLVIVAHDHTDLATPINGHSKACITVQTREVLGTCANYNGKDGSIYINGVESYGRTDNKWSDLYMRTYLNDIVWEAFPSTLKSAIKSSKHYRHTSYNTAESELVIDNIFLPSYPEIFGTVQNSDYVVTNPAEGTQFEYYQTSSNRLKYGNNNGSPTGTAVKWHTSSSSSNFNTTYGYSWMEILLEAGAAKAYSNWVRYAKGLAPAFAM